MGSISALLTMFGEDIAKKSGFTSYTFNIVSLQPATGELEGSKISSGVQTSYSVRFYLGKTSMFGVY